ncbi:hypothetical protein HYT58_01950 [Candidatus Woesearchaeota archaeon]|nr:hypothetical protein [Candidatus Woesearchaeota archaeon]
MKCPKCGSPNVRAEYPPKNVPVTFLKPNRYLCLKCNYKDKSGLFE